MTFEIENLTKTFNGTRALSSLSFAIQPGEIFGFVGSNGAGKTTTMRIMLGVLAPDSGRVLWKGSPVTNADRRRMGYMPEERGLYPKMSVRDQLVYLARLHEFDLAAAREAADRWIERLGLESRAKDEVQALSLGNQQRVQLAAALVHDPDVLVLDEPFSGLDPVAVEVMGAVLRERADTGVPVMFSSHQLDLVERLCDRVGIIARGELISVGTIDELRSSGDHRYVVTADRSVVANVDRWVGALPGTEVESAQDARLVLTLPSQDSDEQRLLHAALAHGAVHEFAPLRPTLSDLFHGVVSSDLASENQRAKDVA